MRGLSKKWLESIQKYWNYSTFCNAWYAAAGHVMSFMHIYLHFRLFTNHSWEYSLLHFIFYPFPLHVHKNFKQYYNHGNHLVFKYVFNDVGIGPLVLKHKIHQRRLCTLSKKVVIWHHFTVLFMIFNFKNDLLFITISSILKRMACQNKLINYHHLKRLFIVKNFLEQQRVPRLQCQTLLITQYLTYDWYM